MQDSDLISQPWAMSFQEICENLQVDPDQGLSDHEAKERQSKYGPNRLQEAKKKTVWQILINQFKSLIILILVAASILAFLFTSWIDGVAIAAAVILNTIIGFFMELKAIRSMEALRQMERVTAKVLREDKVGEIHAADLVPGDIVVFEGGDIASADMRLIETSKLQIDESMLTGESVPVSKKTDPVDKQAQISQRDNMLFKGTAVTRGSGKAVVIAIGMNSELGQISSLVESSQDQFTPLEERLGQFGRKLIWITLAVLVVVAILGIVRGKDMVLMIESAVALAVAAIPEGLPIVATIAMAKGMLRMAKRNALVNRLAAVETLGGTSVIFTDKTGTLTENKMTVTDLVFDSGEIKVQENDNRPAFERQGRPVDPNQDKMLQLALKISVLCNNATLSQDESVGDPLELALLSLGQKGGLNRDDLLDKLPEKREEAFDTETKMMATFHRQNGNFFVAVKGAPEAIINSCSNILTDNDTKPFDSKQREKWLKNNEQLADQGLRMIALATKDVDSTDQQPYQDLTFVALVGMMDPPREDIKNAIDLCRDAGLKVVMVTGDHQKTALNIAKEVGLVSKYGEKVIEGKDIKHPEELSDQEKNDFRQALVFARVSPKQKLDLINIHQLAGSIVAMTGDGVNDAPSLSKADIGIAMGKRGTQVAKEASDMVLKDDSFSTIVEAIKHGRIIFENIRKFIVYLLSGNASEIMIVFFATLLNWPLPILPLQILLLNIISDVFPALALGLSEESQNIMSRPPRDPEQPILTKKHWLAIFGYGLLIAVSVLISFAVALYILEMDLRGAVSVSFLTLAFARLWHIFNMRARGTDFVRNEITENKYVWLAIVFCTCLLLGAAYLPVISSVLQLTGPRLVGWTLIVIFSIIPFVIGQLLKIKK